MHRHPCLGVAVSLRGSRAGAGVQPVDDGGFRPANGANPELHGSGKLSIGDLGIDGRAAEAGDFDNGGEAEQFRHTNSPSIPPGGNRAS